jgi:hypothetical protein
MIGMIMMTMVIITRTSAPGSGARNGAWSIPMSGWRKWLTISGLLTTLVGSGLGAWGSWASREQAVEIGIMRIPGETLEENLTLPAVKNLIDQAELAAVGFSLIAVGTALQLAVLFCPPRTR